MKYWLFKSEPNCFSYDDLLKCKNQTEPWDGVRNYQARNFMRDEMRVGDLGIFYHSNCKPPHAIGLLEIVSAGRPDPTQFDPFSEHPDLTADPKNPRWFLVDVRARGKFRRPVSLSEMREIPDLSDMKLLSRGNRLSVMPIEKKHFELLKKLGGL